MKEKGTATAPAPPAAAEAAAAAPLTDTQRIEGLEAEVDDLRGRIVKLEGATASAGTLAAMTAVADGQLGEIQKLQTQVKVIAGALAAAGYPLELAASPGDFEPPAGV